MHEAVKDGHQFSDNVIARMRPYLKGHVNRFGDYRLNLDRQTPAPNYDLGVVTASSWLVIDSMTKWPNFARLVRYPNKKISLLFPMAPQP